MNKLHWLAFHPGFVTQSKTDAPVERRMAVKPEHDEATGIRVSEVLFSKDLKGLSFCGIGVRHHAVSNFQRELVRLEAQW